jgi:hypothetical protein
MTHIKVAMSKDEDYFILYSVVCSFEVFIFFMGCILLCVLVWSVWGVPESLGIFVSSP